MRFKISIVLLIVAATVSAQEFLQVFSLYKSPEPIVKNVVRYNNATKSKDRIYINTDYCSYMVVRKGARYYNALPGENIVESRPVQSQASEGNYATTEYRYYRGTFPKKNYPQAIYAFPFKAKERILIDPHTIHFKQSERTENYISFAKENNDTVYAMRGGVACLTGDKKGVVINHVDETFAVYYHMFKALVTPGDAVEVGQPIGLVRGENVYVGFVYLDEQYFKQKELATEYPYTHFVPQIWDGTQYVQYEKVTTVVVPKLTDEIITQDMSKSQKKRYFKHKK
jgi:murein DD-endopeptidase MepM/ murein hydrolase activator NlpD